MMTQKDKEEVARAAEMWRLNDERNKQNEADRKRKQVEANLALLYAIAAK